MNSVDDVFHELTEYKAPSWCKELKVIPKYKIRLAMKPTPIHPWKIEGLPAEFSLHVKRDDLTGVTLCGNKVRKLEFILADAKAKGCTDVITSGSTQSNHARATLIAAKQMGLECHLVLRDLQENCRTVMPSANFLLMETMEPNIYLLPWTSFSDKNVMEKFRVVAKHIEKTPGRKPFLIPPGGDTPLGLYGYIAAWEEMLHQNIHEKFDDVVVTTGTSGTAFGLAVGNYLTGSKLRIHAINASRSKTMVHDMLDENLLLFGIKDVRSRDIIDVTDDHLAAGYNLYDDEDFEFCKNIAKTTGIYCDPVYVGKALNGLIAELNNNPRRFKGKRILFVHTGGTFTMLETGVARRVHDDKAVARIKNWEDAFPDE